MALGRARGRERTVDYWPGFVDALSTLLLVFIFWLTHCAYAVYQYQKQDCDNQCGEDYEWFLVLGEIHPVLLSLCSPRA